MRFATSFFLCFCLIQEACAWNLLVPKKPASIINSVKPVSSKVQHCQLSNTVLLASAGDQQEQSNKPSKNVQSSSKNVIANFITTTVIATALLFGGASPNVAWASDEALLNELSKEDSIIIEGRAPPAIQSESSERAMALSQKLKALDAKMFGAYWCKYCAKQKEAFGKEAFETNNIQYVECSEDGQNSQATTLCEEKNIQGYPAWEINGRVYSGERSVEEMEVLVRMAEASVPGKQKAPPKIMTSSSERTLAISQQLEARQSRLFGAYWDPHTFEQLEKLGKDAKIPYVECAKDADKSQLDLCKERNVLVVPTWEINGELFAGDQELDELEKIIATTKPKDVPIASTTQTLASTEKLEDTSTTAAIAEQPPTASVPSTAGDPPKETLSAESKSSDDKSKSLAAATTNTIAMEKEERAPPGVVSASTEKALLLAKQMKSLNARMYGAYFCSHCHDQKEAFGKKAFESIGYVECTQEGKDSQLGLCREKGIRSVPTWEINGKLFVGERSIDQLQALVQSELSQIAKEAVLDVAAQPAVNGPPPIVAVSSKRALNVADQMERLDAKLYGAYWCRYTQAQKERFGSDAFAKIKYVECSSDGLNSASEVCRDKRIDGYPTWEVNGKLYPGDQDLEELEILVAENARR